MWYIIAILIICAIAAVIFLAQWLLGTVLYKVQSIIGRHMRKLVNKDRAALAKALKNEVLSFYTSLTDDEVINEIRQRYPMEPLEKCPLLTPIPTLFIIEALPTRLVLSVNRDGGIVVIETDEEIAGRTHITFTVVEYCDDNGAPRGLRKMESLIHVIVDLCQQYPEHSYSC